MYLRNKDIISITNRGVATVSDTGTYSMSGASTHTLTTSPTAMKNIRSVTVSGSALAYGTDYTVDTDTGILTYNQSQSGAYTISYDYGSTDSVFPDFPQANLKLSAFPRMAVDILGGSGRDLDLGAVTTDYNWNISVVCYATGTEALEDMSSSVVNNLRSDRKGFYNLTYIGPPEFGPVINFPPGKDKILSRSIDFVSRFNYNSN